MSQEMDRGVVAVSVGSHSSLLYLTGIPLRISTRTDFFLSLNLTGAVGIATQNLCDDD